jgi:hypothetical protein
VTATAHAALGLLALVGVAETASAVIITGGPTYSLPGGGSCSVSGFACQTGGATLTCTGINFAAHSKVYFGIRNDINVDGNTMTGSAPTAGSSAVFRIFNTTPTSIVYTSSTTVPNLVLGSQAVANRLELTLVSGSATIVATGGTPADNANGDIAHLFHVTSDFTARVDVKASAPSLPLGQACPAVFDQSKVSPAIKDINKVDVAFYFSDCGDGFVDTPDEQCDLGASNSDPSFCCNTSCQFRTTSEVCRPGAGPPCDSNETCPGNSTMCPADDAPLTLGTVCRSGSGDSCDENEVCTGVPGQGCPVDDAPGKAGVVCRAASVGDFCDQDETCTGAPGATCPLDDAPGKINQVCRAGSGDMCDPGEQCTGVPGQSCPPDVVANPSTVCRAGSGDSCDPNENCTAIPGQPCPSNFVQPSGTQCRAAVDACDVAEGCTGNVGQTCPSNGFAMPGTACDADSNVCTLDECDGSGGCDFDSTLDCDDGNLCSQDSCDPDDGCVHTGAPSNSCTSATKAILKFKNSSNDDKDRVKFVWKGGPSLINDMGDPTQNTRYELCIYDAVDQQLAMGVPPGSGWSAIGSPSSPKGYRYKDSNAGVQGVKLIKTKASNLTKASVKFIGKGFAIPDDDAVMPFIYPVIAQVFASDGMCWEAEFIMTDAKRNDEVWFNAKTQ